MMMIWRVRRLGRVLVIVRGIEMALDRCWHWIGEHEGWTFRLWTLVFDIVFFFLFFL